jgi:hypothetical protein
MAEPPGIISPAKPYPAVVNNWRRSILISMQVSSYHPVTSV